MLANELVRIAKSMLSAIESATMVRQLLGVYGDAQDYIDQLTARMANGGTGLNEAASHVHSHYAQSPQRLSGISLYQVFRQAEELATVFERIGNGYPEDKDALYTAELINSFRQVVDTFAQTHSITDSVPLTKQAAVLRDRLAGIKSAQEALILKLEPDPVGDDFDSIAVILDGPYSLDELIAVLKAIDELCKKLTEIFEKFGLDPQFSIRRLESGSIFLEMIGLKLGIAVLKKLFSDGAEFVYRNFTAEGVMKVQVALQIEAMKNVVKLRGAMKKDGIPTDKLDEALADEAPFLVERIHRVTNGKPVQFDGYRATTVVEPRRLPAPSHLPQIRHEPTLDQPTTGES